MKELVAYLARSLAARPQEVRVTEIPRDNGLELSLKVADEDLNHLIGKQGRTIKAMRSLLAAGAAKSGQRFFLKISSASSADAPSADDSPAAPGEGPDEEAMDDADAADHA